MLNKTMSSIAVVTGAAFGLLLATSSIAIADDGPFESIDLEKSYLMASGDKGEEGKSDEDSGEEASGGEGSGEEASGGEGSGEEADSGEGNGEEEANGGEDQGEGEG
ncbi:MAG: hypothetical protein V3S21_09900 [Xanthomonadales bacterium]